MGVTGHFLLVKVGVHSLNADTIIEQLFKKFIWPIYSSYHLILTHKISLFDHIIPIYTYYESLCPFTTRQVVILNWTKDQYSTFVFKRKFWLSGTRSRHKRIWLTVWLDAEVIQKIPVPVIKSIFSIPKFSQK